MAKIDLDNLIPSFDDDAFETVEPDSIEDSHEDLEHDIDPEIEGPTEDPIVIKPTEEDEEEPSPNPGGAENGDEVATLFYQKLVDEGIITPQEDKETYSWEDVKQATTFYREELPKQVAMGIIQSSPELGQTLIDYVFTKGEQLKKEDLKEFLNTYLEDIEMEERSMDFSDIEKARDFLADEYKKQGFKDQQIELLLDALEDESEEALKTQATEIFNKQKEQKKSTAILEQEKTTKNQLLQEQREAEKRLAQAIDAELTNTGWKPTRINLVKQHLFNGETSKVLAKAAKAPAALVQLADLATYFDEKTGKFDLQAYINQMNSKEAVDLKEKIKRDMFSSASGSTKSRSANPNSKFDLEKLKPVFEF